MIFLQEEEAVISFLESEEEQEEGELMTLQELQGICIYIYMQNSKQTYKCATQCI